MGSPRGSIPAISKTRRHWWRSSGADESTHGETHEGRTHHESPEEGGMTQGAIRRDLGSLVLRPGTAGDAEACGRVCYEAFRTLAERHGFPPDFPSATHAAAL